MGCFVIKACIHSAELFSCLRHDIPITEAEKVDFKKIMIFVKIWVVFIH